MKVLTWLFLMLLMGLCFLLPPALAGEKKNKKKEKNMIKITYVFNKKVVELGEEYAGSLELTNISDKPILLKWRVHKFLEFITFETRMPNGKKIETKPDVLYTLSDFQWFPQFFVFMPGEKLTYTSRLIALAENPPGVYQRKAIFEYRDPDDPKAPVLRAEADAEIEVRVPKKK